MLPEKSPCMHRILQILYPYRMVKTSKIKSLELENSKFDHFASTLWELRYDQTSDFCFLHSNDFNDKKILKIKNVI